MVTGKTVFVVLLSWHTVSRLCRVYLVSVEQHEVAVDIWTKPSDWYY